MEKLKGESIYKLTAEQAEERILNSEGTAYLAANKTNFSLFLETYPTPDLFVIDLKTICQSNWTYNSFTNEQETGPHKSRSIIDVFRITKFYYPDFKLRQLFELLFSWYKKGTMDYLYCPDIKRSIANFSESPTNWRKYENRYWDNMGKEFGYYGVEDMFKGVLELKSLYTTSS